MPHLAEYAYRWERVDVLLDKETSSQRDQWDAMRETLFGCFPGGTLLEGNFFDRYRIEAAILSQPECTPVRMQLSYIDEDSHPQELSWALSGGLTSSLRVLCEQDREGVIWIEAENFEWGPGWKADVAFVNGWEGDGYLVDSYGSQESKYGTALPVASEAYAWVRYYKRVVDDWPGYVHLGDAGYPFADVVEENTNQWIWERVGPFALPEGEQGWRITRPYEQPAEGFMALFIDSVVFTTDAGFSPTSIGHRQIVYDEIYSLSKPAQTGIMKFILPSGRYYCRVSVETGQSLVDAYGQPEIWSNDLGVEMP